MKVRYSYLKQQFTNCNDLWSNLKKFVSTGDFTLGKELEKFEKNFSKLIGTKYAIGVNSGTDAIKLSLKVLHNFCVLSVELVGRFAGRFSSDELIDIIFSGLVRKIPPSFCAWKIICLAKPCQLVSSEAVRL